MPKISIIIPAYNTGKYLEKCLNSLVHQTLDDIEILVVDDGSTDNTSIIAQEYADTYNNIIFLKKENGGQADARNLGLRYANGEYIGFVDSDDYTNTAMYKKMYDAVKQTDADIAECEYFIVQRGKLLRKPLVNYTSDTILAETKPCVWNKIIKRSIIAENNLCFPSGLIYEDFEYISKLVLYIKKYVVLNEPLYYYVQHPLSTLHSSNKRVRDIYTVYDNIIDYYNRNGIYRQYETQLEYIAAKYLLCGNLLTIVKIKDKKMRCELLYENWWKLHRLFPNWKNNLILRKTISKINIYLKTLNWFTYKLYSYILFLIYNNSRKI